MTANNMAPIIVKVGGSNILSDYQELQLNFTFFMNVNRQQFHTVD